jgi:hypothetical protein
VQQVIHRGKQAVKIGFGLGFQQGEL